MDKTIKDVAQRAGVSIATVSRVLNGNYPVKQETKTRIEQAMKDLAYIPNQQARALSTRKSEVIGIVTPSINNMFFTEVISAAEKALKEAGYSILLYSFHHERSQEQLGVKDLLSRGVAGIIALDPGNRKVKTFYTKLAKQIPLVFVNGEHFDAGISYIYNDEAKGALAALEHLYSLGKRNIVFLRGGPSHSYDIKEDVYRRFCEQHQLPMHIQQIQGGNGTETVQDATQCMEEVVQHHPMDAIFACNDLMALGCLNACKVKKKKVPKEIAIIGFDNIPLASYVTPQLSSVDQNMEELGKGAAQLVLEKIQQHNRSSKQIILNNTLIIRESTQEETL